LRGKKNRQLKAHGHAINDQSRFAFENVNDLFLRMRMLWHTTPRRQRGKHLIHRLAMGNRPARNAGTNFNRRIFWFHLQNLTPGTY